MMKDITITYFDARGRAELSRTILALKAVKYNDERLTREEWQARKQSKFHVNNFRRILILQQKR